MIALSGEESPNTPTVMWSLVAGNARPSLTRGASRDVWSESKGTPYVIYYVRSSHFGNKVGETAKSLPACKAVLQYFIGESRKR